MNIEKFSETIKLTLQEEATCHRLKTVEINKCSLWYKRSFGKERVCLGGLLIRKMIKERNLFLVGVVMPSDLTAQGGLLSHYERCLTKKNRQDIQLGNKVRAMHHLAFGEARAAFEVFYGNDEEYKRLVSRLGLNRSIEIPDYLMSTRLEWRKGCRKLVSLLEQEGL